MERIRMPASGWSRVTPGGLTLDQVWLFAAVAFIALRALLTPIPPHDFWWHMATGRLIVTSGQIPAVDAFSYTRAGEPFYNQSWLAQILLYGLYSLGGAPIIVVAQALVLALAYGLLLWLCVKRSGAARLSAGFLMIATMPASFDNWVVRPQTYALPLFIATLTVLTLWRSPELRGGQAARFYRPLLLLPILGLIWVNLHGSFILGGVLIALVFIGEAARRWAAAWAESRSWANRPVGRAEDVLTQPVRPAQPPLWHLAAVGILTGLSWLVNPGGVQVIGYVRNLLGSSQVTEMVAEWAPPTIRDLNGMIFFLFLLTGITILIYTRRPPDPVELFVTGAFLWLALGAVRNNIWFTAVATPLLVAALRDWRSAQEQRAYQGVPTLNAVLAGVIVLMLLLALPWVKPVLGLPPQLGNVIEPMTPVAAVERLRADPDRPARLFHAMGYGSYLIWAAPEQPVWADPRIELYPVEQWRDYQVLSSGLEVERLLAKYAIDGLLLSNTEQEPLVEWAKAHPEAWELRYADEETSYFVRRK